VRPIWARLESSNLSIWSALVAVDSVLSATSPSPAVPEFSVDDPHPNPVSTGLGFSFKLHRRSLVSLSLVDVQSRERAKLIDSEWREYGKYLEKVDVEKLALSAGTYFMVLTVDGVVQKKKIVVAE